MNPQKIQWMREECTKLPLSVLQNAERKASGNDRVVIGRIIREKLNGCRQNAPVNLWRN